MYLRSLQQKDAPLMLEWMHDTMVVEKLQADFASKTLEDCLSFIESAQDYTADIHLAVVDDSDTYMGTASLKHIENRTAEFAITVRRAAMGKGFSAYAMKTMLPEKGSYKGIDL